MGDEIKKVAEGVTDTSDRLAESMMSYRDTLSLPVQQGQAAGTYLTQLNPRPIPDSRQERASGPVRFWWM